MPSIGGVRIKNGMSHYGLRIFVVLQKVHCLRQGLRLKAVLGVLSTSIKVQDDYLMLLVYFYHVKLLEFL